MFMLKAMTLAIAYAGGCFSDWWGFGPERLLSSSVACSKHKSFPAMIAPAASEQPRTEQGRSSGCGSSSGSLIPTVCSRCYRCIWHFTTSHCQYAPPTVWPEMPTGGAYLAGCRSDCPIDRTKHPLGGRTMRRSLPFDRFAASIAVPPD
jgi:hypothetical protein